MRAGRDDDRVLQAGGFDARPSAAALCGLVSVKSQRIGRDEVLVVFDPRRRRTACAAVRLALMRKWCAHFGQTLRLVARSLL